MKRQTNSAVGALHPFIFFAFVYIVALFFSIFICTSIFYSCNTTASTKPDAKLEKTIQKDAGQFTVASVIR